MAGATSHHSQRTTTPVIDIYDPQFGPAVWNIDLGLGVVFSVCLLQALVGNVVILFLFVRYRRYMSVNAFTVLAVTLCISDVSMVLLSGVPNVISLLQRRQPLHQRFCDVSGFVLNFNNRLNSFVTTCICLVRGLVVVMPIKARILLDRAALAAMVTCCVILAGFYSSLPFLFNYTTNPHNHITKYVYDHVLGFCMFFVNFDESERSLRLLSSLLIEAVFFAPFIVAIITSSLLIYTLRRRHSVGLEVRRESKRSAVGAIIKVTVLTLICVTPQLAFSVYSKLRRAYGLDWFSLRTELYLNYMFSHQLIIYLRASINPFIIDMPAYLKRGREMRQNVMKRQVSAAAGLSTAGLCTQLYQPATSKPANSARLRQSWAGEIEICQPGLRSHLAGHGAYKRSSSTASIITIANVMPATPQNVKAVAPHKGLRSNVHCEGGEGSHQGSTAKPPQPVKRSNTDICRKTCRGLNRTKSVS